MSEADVARVRRALVRLEALARRRRRWAVLRRAGRGGLGFLVGFGVLLKVKVVTTLAGKLFLAALLGVTLAWPVIGLVIAIPLAILAFLEGEGDVADCDGCSQGRERRRRLDAMIAAREQWLAAPSLPVPRARPRSSRA